MTSGITIREPFWTTTTKQQYNFGTLRISRRIANKSTPFLKHQLMLLPTKVYFLHCKIEGTYWLYTKLQAEVRCQDLLEEMIMEMES